MLLALPTGGDITRPRGNSLNILMSQNCTSLKSMFINMLDVKHIFFIIPNNGYEDQTHDFKSPKFANFNLTFPFSFLTSTHLLIIVVLFSCLLIGQSVIC